MDIERRDKRKAYRSDLMENKKGGEVSTFFAPNLTMNLTYLCYGRSKVIWLWASTVKNTPKSTNYR
ncbi:MAG: hypothetical protein WBG90_15135 [Saonia sp.]